MKLSAPNSPLYTVGSVLPGLASSAQQEALKTENGCDLLTSVEPTEPAQILELTTPSQAKSPARKGFEAFSSTFLTIFLAELGDKTQITTLLMSAESQAPWIVFIGAGSALVLTSLLGVWVGRWMANRFSPETLKTASGTFLLLISVLLLWDVVHL